MKGTGHGGHGEQPTNHPLMTAFDAPKAHLKGLPKADRSCLYWGFCLGFWAPKARYRRGTFGKPYGAWLCPLAM